MRMSPWFEKIYNEAKDTPDFLRAELALEVTDQLWKRMQELGITQAEVARRMGLSQPYIAKIMSYETNISLMTLVKLAQALELRVEPPKLVPVEKPAGTKKSNGLSPESVSAKPKRRRLEKV